MLPTTENTKIIHSRNLAFTILMVSLSEKTKFELKKIAYSFIMGFRLFPSIPFNKIDLFIKGSALCDQHNFSVLRNKKLIYGKGNYERWLT
jgi:hypothetical protein